eukprot:COSAG01_NODE_20478_length_951_cov_1.634977_1_plen_179_part_00
MCYAWHNDWFKFLSILFARSQAPGYSLEELFTSDENGGASRSLFGKPEFRDIMAPDRFRRIRKYAHTAFADLDNEADRPLVPSCMSCFSMGGAAFEGPGGNDVLACVQPPPLHTPSCFLTLTHADITQNNAAVNAPHALHGVGLPPFLLSVHDLYTSTDLCTGPDPSKKCRNKKNSEM